MRNLFMCFPLAALVTACSGQAGLEDLALKEMSSAITTGMDGTEDNEEKEPLQSADTPTAGVANAPVGTAASSLFNHMPPSLFNHMPQDLTEKIYSYSLLKDAVFLSSVSSQWRKEGIKTRLGRRGALQTLDLLDLTKYENPREALARMLALSLLAAIKVRVKVNKHVNVFLAEMNRLRTLDRLRTSKWYDLSRVVGFDLSGSGITRYGLNELALWDTLEEVDLSENPKLGARGWVEFTPGWPNLRELYLFDTGLTPVAQNEIGRRLREHSPNVKIMF